MNPTFWPSLILLLPGLGVSAGARPLAVMRFARRAIADGGTSDPAVSILKPLHGDEPGSMKTCGRSPSRIIRRWQIVLGVNDPQDGALDAARALIRDFPGGDVALVVDRRIRGEQPQGLEPRKHAAGGAPRHPRPRRQRHAGRSALSAPRSPRRLDDPQTGIVTCLYKGVPTGGIWSELGAMHINFGFLPSALVGEALGVGRGCFGATIALRRDTLERIGGFARVRDELADDHRLGDAVRAQGLARGAVALSGRGAGSEPSLAALWRHELRWARTVRGIAPAAFAGSIVTHPLVVAALAAAFAGFGLTACIFLAITWLLRWACGEGDRRRARTAGGQALAAAGARRLVLRRVRRQLFRTEGVLAGPAFSRRGERPHDSRRRQGLMMKTLFLHPPSFDGFDGGAGSRYQARREIRSFWYPTWLAQPAALVPGSRLIDAPPARLKLADMLPLAGDYELAVLHTSTPSFASDVKVAEALKDANPRLKIGMVGAKVAVEPEDSLKASAALDFVAREEFDFTIKEVAEGRAFACDRRAELAQRRRRRSATTATARSSKTWTSCPSSAKSTSATCRVEDYFIGYLKHPYLSLYTGRGCRSKCTFCLWPQTVGGHRYRVRSVGHVIEEIRLAKSWFPQVKEFFFDDDTFTDDRPRAEAIARELGKLGVTWSCNAKANVPRATLEVLRDNGLRLLLVGYESGNQQILNNIKKGMRIDIARRFTKDCHELGITIHGTFILGLPGETEGDDRGNDPLCRRDQPAHDPGVAGRALSRHLSASAGGRERLARHRRMPS